MELIIYDGKQTYKEYWHMTQMYGPHKIYSSKFNL
jgi:hypothetical protein